MRLELALDVRCCAEAVVELAMSYELPDDAHARMKTRAVVRAGACCWYRGLDSDESNTAQ